MIERFSRCLILVVGDFNRGADEVLVMRDLGANVLAAGFASAKVKRNLQEHGVGVLGLERSKRAAEEAASLRVGGCDAVLFTATAWPQVIEHVKDAEQQTAIADGRAMIPLIQQTDSRYRFLRQPADWAVFTLARAAGADIDATKGLIREYRRGQQKKNTKTAGGSRNRSRASRKRRHA
jgi:hypothetical protein